MGIAASLVFMAVAAIIFTEVRRTANAPVAAEDSGIDAAARRVFLEETATPLLSAAHARDMAAADRARQQISEHFARYAEGIPKFASSLTGWGMRFRILYRKGVETAKRKPEHSWTAALVQEKFAEHVVSDARLEADITETMKQFAFDLEASRNELAASLEAGLRGSPLHARLPASQLTAFRSDLVERMNALLAAMPTQSVTIGTGSLAAGIAAEESVRLLIRTVLAQGAARAATTAAAAGGATATAAAAGAAGGTAVAPGVGTAIGIAGGFLAGAAVDWWMTDEFEDRISAQCRLFLEESKSALLTGPDGLEALISSELQRRQTSAGDALQQSLNPPLP
jgi:hypothetical protein